MQGKEEEEKTTNTYNNSDMICAVLMFPLFWIESDVNSRTINSILWHTLWLVGLLISWASERARKRKCERERVTKKKHRKKPNWPWYTIDKRCRSLRMLPQITETLKLCSITNLRLLNCIYEYAKQLHSIIIWLSTWFDSFLFFSFFSTVGNVL